MQAGVVVRCERRHAEEFLGNQVRELSALLGPLEILFLSHDRQVIAFKQELALTPEVSARLERLRLMTRSLDSEIYVSTGIFPASHLTLATQLTAQVARLAPVQGGAWDAAGWRPVVFGPLVPRS